MVQKSYRGPRTKVTPEILKDWKVLRAEGFSYKEIANIYPEIVKSHNSVAYFLDPKIKQRTKIYARKWVMKNPDKIKKFNERAKEYRRKYMYDRYNNDEEFRKRMIQYVLDYQKRQRLKKKNDKTISKLQRNA